MVLLNPLRQAGLAFRRDHTLGLLLERLAEVRGPNDLVEEADGGLTVTVAEAAALVDLWAGGIAERVRPGQVVVVATPNGYEQLLLCLAASRAGAIPAPVNSLMRPDEIAHVEQDSGAPLTIHAASELPSAPALGNAVPARPEDVAALFYTSGTTGKPKGVELSHRSLVGSLVAGTLIPSGLRNDSAVVSLPIAHIMGFAISLALACAGVPVWFLPRFNPVRVLNAIESRNASVYVGVPAMYRMLLEAGAERRDLKSVRLWISGADAMPADLASTFKKMGATAVLPLVGAVGEAAFAEGYGMVETGGGVAAKFSPPGFSKSLGSSMGMALPGYSFKVVDDDGNEVPRGTTGELLVKGPGVLRGYRGDAEATAATLTDDGWLRTGDLARLGPRNVVFFAGRKKDVIKHGGYSVYAVEIEQALEQHPDVVEAAVIGLPDERKGELPAAVVRLAEGATLDEAAMRAWAAERLSDYKVPVRIVAADELPRTGTNKVQRKELLGLFEAP
jgi:acyl-CoA synthetase (AMP-forming)/AMP-acid ligase II